MLIHYLKNKTALLFILLLSFFILAGCEQPALTGNYDDGMLRVHFLNVGQADCGLIQLPGGETMLVDAGNNGDAYVITNYLNKLRIKKLDYVVGTHPHEDHIGSMDIVLKMYDAGKIFMPQATTNTRTFRDMLAMIKNKGMKITIARAGVNIIDSGDLAVDIMAPCGKEYGDLNNYSAVIRIKYGNVCFLLTGDAEEQSESEMLAADPAGLRADVLKIGHHGSSSSTSADFLRAVSPKYAVISVGAGNDYGHPHRETLARLNKAGVKVLRTDELGTIVFQTDGREISYQSKRR